MQGLKHYFDLEQGTDEWLAARCGLLTASEMKNIITPKKLQYSCSEKERSHLYELAAQRITKYVEPSFVSDDMLRGQEDEPFARMEYSRHYEPVRKCGFITNDKWGFTLGYSPDGLVGHKGLIEVKSRRQKYQLQTIIDREVSSEFLMQLQTGMLVSERLWCDFVSYCGGMPMCVIRVYGDQVMQSAILEAAAEFYGKLETIVAEYSDRLSDTTLKHVPTERRIQQEITA